MPVVFGDVILEQRFYVLDIEEDAILGSDFLVSHHGVIDLA